MHLITPLISGVAGAENGTIHLYRRGAAGTYVTYYTSFEGDGATTPTGGVLLDAHGGGEFYVNEATLCIVNDSDGVTIRSFVAGDGAPSVEVISQSFTGTDYETGQRAAQKPIWLSTLLDLWLTNSGAKDFKVDIAGTETTLQDAFATVGFVFINVKSELYGAIGDGVVNDTAAIQAALDAASVAGGGTVFFPKGTYRTTTALTVPANVSLEGVGPAASVIQQSNGATNILTFAASNTYFSSVKGLRIETAADTAGGTYHISAVAGNKLRIENCHIGSSHARSYNIEFGTVGSILFVLNTTFEMGNGLSAIHCASTGVAAYAIVIGCKFIFNGVFNGNTLGLAAGVILGCVFDCTGITSGVAPMVNFFSGASAGGAVGMALVIGNHVTNPTGGTVSLLNGIQNATLDGVTLFGNRLGSAVLAGSAGAAATKTAYFGQYNLQRDRGAYYVLDNGATVALDPHTYAQCQIERTSTAVQTVNLTAYLGSYGPANQPLTLVYNNLNQAAVTGTITLGTGFSGLTSFTVNANRYSVYFFRSVHYETSIRYVLVGSAVNLS
jgi:hypothetical protein